VSFHAFEITVNGKHLYTAGADDWRQVWCNVLAHRIPPEVFRSLEGIEASEVPDKPVTELMLSTNVTVSVDKDMRPDSPHDITKNGSYPRMNLKLGDVVQIRIIETDSSNEPDWQNSENRGPIAIQSLPE
jgi:hypothetical protein